MANVCWPPPVERVRSINDTGMSVGETVLPREYQTVPTRMRAWEQPTTGSWLSTSPGCVPPAIAASTERASSSAREIPVTWRWFVR